MANETTDFGNSYMLDTLARAYYQTGDTAQAIATLKRALESSPQEAVAFRSDMEALLARYTEASGR